MSDDTLRAVLDRPVESVEDVIQTMRAIAAELPPQDGVARFNQLYLSMTESVRSSIAVDRFEDAAFMARLDVVFAGYYFDAVRRGITSADAVPMPWRPLFAARHRVDRHPLLFALCGMNAHINYDLAHALVATAGELGGAIEFGSARHRDYDRINRVLAETEPTVKQRFLDGVLAELDRAFGDVDDRAALWSIFRARDAAWTSAALMWWRRSSPAVTIPAGLPESLSAEAVGLIGKLLVL